MQKKVIVIGGGIIGLSIAYRLVKNNIKVIIIEKGEIGKEASWAAAGMLRPLAESEDESLLRLGLESIKLYDNFAKELKEDTEININYRECGTIILSYTDKQLIELKARYDKQKNAMIEWVNNQEILKLEHNINPNIKGAVLINGDNWADNRLIISALSKALKKYNADIYEHCTAESYIHKGNKIIGISSSCGDFFAEYVINSCGSWAGQIRSHDGKLIPPIKPILGQIIAIKSNDLQIKHNICTFNSYIAQRDKNTILIGSTMEDIGFNKRINIKSIVTLINNAIQLVPKIKECEFLDVWAGFRPTSPDKLPILGKTSAEGLLIATGTYRNGILLTPIIGKLISDIIIRGKEDELLKAFKLQRFFN